MTIPVVVTALLIAISSADSVTAPDPVPVAPEMVSVPVVLRRLTAPASVAVAVKAAPFDSVMKTPPDPVDAVIVPAVVKIGATLVPMAPAAAPVDRATVPLPTLSNVLAVCVMLPPVVFPPLLVLTVIVPPSPVVTFRRAAVPVPPALLLTRI